MRVLVDTSVWSLALRRRAPGDPRIRQVLTDLIEDGRVVLIGPVRQELLSGIRETRHFEVLRQRMRAFPDLELGREDFERAAEAFNLCRRQGVQGSNKDFLLCAVAELRRIPLFTTDRDFTRFAELLPFELFAG